MVNCREYFLEYFNDYWYLVKKALDGTQSGEILIDNAEKITDSKFFK